MHSAERALAYCANSSYDEVVNGTGEPRSHYLPLANRFAGFSPEELGRRLTLAELSFRNQGITFTLADDPMGSERLFPFDPFPRLIPQSEWRVVEAGLIQRVKALNLFLGDLYHEQQVLADGVFPRFMVVTHPDFIREVYGLNLPHQAYTNVAGIDLIRSPDGIYRVLEDNLQIPSGASYMVANRRVMTRTFPRAFGDYCVSLVETYTDRLLAMLRSLSPRDVSEPRVVVLTPGAANSAYFEHVYLAQQMGVEVVEGQDLFVDEGRVWMRTAGGKVQVDVIYRRVSDDFLDPAVFRPNSVLGVAGLLEVYRQGRVALANAIGTGVADSKSAYAFVPKLIEYYLGEKPVLAQVDTYLGQEPDQLEYMLAHISELVFKPIDQAGGKGIFFGPEATPEQLEAQKHKILANPAGYIAQPIIQLSTHPTFNPGLGDYEPRHIDLRPFILVGEKIEVAPGGLTRVAGNSRTLVVNSSQGGGSKDTWVVDDLC